MAVCPVEELPPGEMKLVRTDTVDVGVYNIDGELLALEDRCSHDDGPLSEGAWDPGRGLGPGGGRPHLPASGLKLRYPQGGAAAAAGVGAGGDLRRARRGRHGH